MGLVWDTKSDYCCSEFRTQETRFVIRTFTILNLHFPPTDCFKCLQIQAQETLAEWRRSSWEWKIGLLPLLVLSNPSIPLQTHSSQSCQGFNLFSEATATVKRFKNNGMDWGRRTDITSMCFCMATHLWSCQWFYAETLHRATCRSNFHWCDFTTHCL